MMEQPELYIDVPFLNSNFGKLPSVIEKLETRNICLYDAINIFENTIQSIENVQGEIGDKIATKFRKSLSKNFNYQKIKCISSILQSYLVITKPLYSESPVIK